MDVLVVGSGGRESAIVWKLSQSPVVDKIYVAPGNGGTCLEPKAINVDIQVADTEGLLKFALDNKIDLTVVGPEVPLCAGIVDLFEDSGLKIFGPCKKAANLESSKRFAKEVMQKAGVPTAHYAVFNNYVDAKRYIEDKGAPIVVKADGLASGKGVTVAFDLDTAISAIDDIFNKNVFGDSGKEVVIEEYLEGEEVSYLVVCDGKTIIPLVSSQDHKAIFDGDKGPNTGGMGAYSPAFVIDPQIYPKLADLVCKPVIDELRSRGINFKGILYAGLMVNKKGYVKVLEYNVRFGDPETQVILPGMKSDLAELMLKVCEGDLGSFELIWHDYFTTTVVMASGGYPGEFSIGKIITGIEDADSISGVKVFHAATVQKQGAIYSSGGRVLNVTATGATLEESISLAYKGVSKINFEGEFYRKDIGSKGLINK